MSSISTGFVPAQIDCAREIPVITITGRLDANNAPVFDGQVAPLLAQAQSRILLDLSALKYISSAGLLSIIRIIKHTSISGGRTGIFSVPALILEILDISGVQSLVDIYPDRETALNGSSG